MKKVPVVLVCGYLGAGKTTFIRETINRLKDRRIAIILNEFGEIAIDSEVIKGKFVDMVEIGGGCVCCSLTGELKLAINEIVEKVKPELIIIEATGVAEPDGVIFNLYEMENIILDLVITIVDAESLKSYEQIGYVGRIQIESADVIILNKLDLIDKSIVEELKEKIRAINKDAPIIEAIRCKVDIETLLGYEHKQKEIEKEEHEHPFQYFSYVSEKTFSIDWFRNFLESLPKNVIRAKGFIKTDKGGFYFNYVNGRYEFENFDVKENKILFIGIDIENIKEELFSKLNEKGD